MKKIISAIIVFCITVTAFNAVFAIEESHSYNDLQRLYDTVVNYIFNSEASLTALITDEEDTVCAKAINAAKLIILTTDSSSDEINIAYKELYSTFSLLMLINQRGQTAASPERIALLKSLYKIILDDEYYSFLDDTQGNKISSDADGALSVIDSSDSENEISESLTELYNILYTAAKMKAENYYRYFNALDFADILPSDWYYDAVGYVYNAGLFKGTSPTEFSPNLTMTRAMFITVLSRFAFAETLDAESGFSDVPQGMYYSGPVLWAKENGILNWIEDTEFLPDEPITRQEMFMCMYNYSRGSGFDDSEYDFSIADRISDIDSISPAAQTATRWCYSTGVISGYGDNTVKPYSTATRAEVAQVFINLTEIMGV